MAAPHTNNGYKSEKKWRDALLRAGNRRSDGKGSPKMLELVADKCFSEALKGEGWATKEIGDRYDGKPVQGVELGVDVRITRVEYRIVDASAVDGELAEPAAALTAPLAAIPAPDEAE